MMEVKQSPANGLEFKELNKDKLNGVRPQPSSELGQKEMLCLSGSEHKEAAAVQNESKLAGVAAKTQSPPQFLTGDLLETLQKSNGDMEFDGDILNDEIATTESGNNAETDDIDIFAEAFLNEIIENDKETVDDELLERELDDELLDECTDDDDLLCQGSKKQESKGSNIEYCEKKCNERDVNQIEVSDVQTQKASTKLELEKDNKEIGEDVTIKKDKEKSPNLEGNNKDVAKNTSEETIQDVPENKNLISSPVDKNLEADDLDVIMDKLEKDSSKSDSDFNKICLEATMEDDAALKDDAPLNDEDTVPKEEDVALDDKNITSNENREPIKSDNIPIEEPDKFRKEIEDDDVSMEEASLDDVSISQTDEKILEVSQELEEIDVNSPEEYSQHSDMTEPENAKENKDSISLDTNIEDEKSDDIHSKNNDVDSLLSQISEAIEDKPGESNVCSTDSVSQKEDDIISLDSPMQVDEGTNALECDKDNTEQTLSGSEEKELAESKSKALESTNSKELDFTDAKKAEETGFESDDDDVVLLDAHVDEKIDTKSESDVVLVDAHVDDKTDSKSENDVVLLDAHVDDKNNTKSESDIEADLKEQHNDISNKNEIDSDDDDVLMVTDNKEQSEEKSESDNKSEVFKKINEKLKEDNEKTKPESIKEDDDDVVLLDDDDKTDEEDELNVVSGESEEKSTVDQSKIAENDVADDEEEEIFSINTGTSAITKADEADDDVVLLDNDVEADASSKKFDGESKDEVVDIADTTKPTDIKKDVNLVSDNSDNAQDKFPEESHATTTEPVEESTSNDGDNNLLEEAASPQNSRSNDDQFYEEKVKQSESENSENSQEPPIKKNRMDDDEQSKMEDITTELEESTNEKTTMKEDDLDIGSKSMKRSLSPEHSSQESKKMKVSDTVKLKSTSTNIESKSMIIDDKSDENWTPKKSLKVDLNLDFLKRFKKSINKMTKLDLEELVLQKIVEAIVHRSEFSEMRDLIEKQEKMIATHRTKIAEITKQFRDLEMVHSRVVKDLEQKNQQFIMPVKITRAVGLQVLIPKRTEHTASSTTKTTPTNADRMPAVSNAPTTTTQHISPVAAGTRPVEGQKRVRCNQKVTPLRPDTPQRPLLNVPKHAPISTPVTSSINTPTMPTLQQLAPQHKPPIVYKTIIRNMPVQQQQPPAVVQSTGQGHVVQQGSTVTHITNNPQLMATAAVRKSTTPRSSPQQPTVQKQSFNLQSSPDRPRVPPMILKKTTNGRCLTVANPPTMSPNASQTQPTPPQAGGPTNKSFIDLTDEDDGKPAAGGPSLPALVAIPPQQKSTVTPQNRITTYVISKPNSAPQRVTVTQNGTARIPPKTTYIPIAPKPSPTSLPAPVAPALTAINSTRLQAPAAAAIPAPVRLAKHPAPLPKPPHIATNPLWKSPPPRPTIRINNIDTGIVISWTMDEMNDTNAEVTSYQIYAYQETSAPPQVEAWRHVGDVKAMLLPMAVTLTQFQEGQRYFFAVRAVDSHSRYGPFSMPKTWS